MNQVCIEYALAVDKYFYLLAMGRKEEADRLMEVKIMPMLEEQPRSLKGGEAYGR